MNLDLYGGSIMLILGIFCFIFSEKIAQMWWQGFPNNFWRKNPWTTKLLGVVLIIIGAIFIIKGFF